MTHPVRLYGAWRRHLVVLRASTQRSADAGAAMIITMMIVALITVITTSLFVATVGNIGSARAARDASSALDAADAGASQAMSYLRTEGITTINCTTCAGVPWTQANPTAGKPLGSPTQSYRVWIEPRSPFPTNNPGIYTIHSTGRAGDGVRSIEVDVSIGSTRMNIPIGVYARSINGGGSASVTNASVFSTECILDRSKIALSGTDANYKIPAAAHSSQYISKGNGNGNGNNGSCSSAGSIHASGACNSTYPYDQDAQGGGPLTGSCATAMTDTVIKPYYTSKDLDGNGTVDVNGSYIRDAAALRTLYNIPEKPFTDSQLDDLRAIAQAQGSYYTAASGYSSPDPTVYPNAVVFFDLKDTHRGETVDLNSLSGWGRAKNLSATSASCLPRSLVIVISGGNAKLNSNQQMAASLILTSPAPYGQLDKANGTADYIGSIYADTVTLVGNVDISLDECFMTNLSPALLSLTMVELEYREIDRTE